MDIAHPLLSEVIEISFRVLTSEDIRSISEVRVENATLLDNLNMPTRGGLYDPRLGPMKKGDM
jgi:DNA-directed RNA polymerase I subunit RPA1